jgi:hypothetical protein
VSASLLQGLLWGSLLSIEATGSSEPRDDEDKGPWAMEVSGGPHPGLGSEDRSLVHGPGFRGKLKLSLYMHQEKYCLCKFTATCLSQG